MTGSDTQKVYRASCNGGRRRTYHTEMCRYAEKIEKRGYGRWVDKDSLDRFGWDECKVCANDVNTDTKQGPKLSDILARMDADEVGT